MSIDKRPIPNLISISKPNQTLQCVQFKLYT